MDGYIYIFKLTWSRAIDYRFNLLFNFIYSFLPIIAMLFLWQAIFGETDQIQNYNFKVMLTYIVISRFLYLLILPDFFFDVSEEIQSGTLSNYLTKPTNYIAYWFFKTMGSKSQSLAFGILPITIIFFIYKEYFKVNNTYESLLFFISSSFLAYILYFLIFMIISLLSFWFYEISNWFYTISFIIEFFSGALIPINILPLGLQNMLEYLPFKYLIYFPINIFLGNISMIDTKFGIMAQLIWFVILAVILKFVWVKGRKKYYAFGG